MISIDPHALGDSAVVVLTIGAKKIFDMTALEMRDQCAFEGSACYVIGIRPEVRGAIRVSVVNDGKRAREYEEWMEAED